MFLLETGCREKHLGGWELHRMGEVEPVRAKVLAVESVTVLEASDATPPAKFWSRFEGAFSALVTAARGNGTDWPTTTARGGIKIARRDAITLAEGIAALLQIVADARRESTSPPAPPDDGVED